jgi:hypothetical protein
MHQSREAHHVQTTIFPTSGSFPWRRGGVGHLTRPGYSR